MNSIPNYVITFVTMIIHLWIFLHAHLRGVMHHMPSDYRHHIAILDRQVRWLFRHISGRA